MLDLNSDWITAISHRIDAALQAQAKAARLALPELNAKQSEALLTSAPTETPPPQEWIRSTVKNCGGSPLLLIEALRRGLADDFSAATEALGSLSEKISDSCRQRWLALSEGAQALLIFLLSRGISVDLPQCRKIWPRNPEEFESACRELEQKGLLRRNPDHPQRRDFAQSSLRRGYLELFPR
jgi:hypothetical protein